MVINLEELLFTCPLYRLYCPEKTLLRVPITLFLNHTIGGRNGID